eukprot:SAG11_NODE_775_length_7226_cov_2.988214_6_plen_36_part_00
MSKVDTYQSLVEIVEAAARDKRRLCEEAVAGSGDG